MNKANNNLDLLYLESLRNKLFINLSNKSSFTKKLLDLYNYFDKILSFKDQNISEAYITEFIYDYLKLIKYFEAFGVEPNFSLALINQLKILRELCFLNAESSFILDEIERITSQVNLLYLSLNGNTFDERTKPKGYFILLDKYDNKFIHGFIESITVKISASLNNNNFIIVPSEYEIDERLYIQCEKSWNIAVKITKKYVKKFNKYHEIIIIFNKKIGFYEGDSFGLALTLIFVQELLKYYNPTYQIFIKDICAFSGSITDSEEILETGETLIKRKVRAVFYSDISKYIIPKKDEKVAQKTLEELKRIYPNRNLKIISVENFSDIFNRRDLIDFKKINPFVRSIKFAKKNLVTFFSLIILSIFLSYLLVLDLDNNPETIFLDGEKAYIKNKNGKTLFYLEYLVDKIFLTNPIAKFNYFKILDINGDEINEIIYVNKKYNPYTKSSNKSSIKCINNKNELLWEYVFEDTVYSEREILPPDYDFKLIDTILIDNKLTLLFWVNNGPSFSTAISGIEVNTGKRIQKTFWGSGHTIDACLHDINNDGIKDIIGCGVDNGFEDAVVWGIEINKINGYRPTTKAYKIKGRNIAELIFYFRVPKQDIDLYFNARHPNIRNNMLEYKEFNKTISVGFHTNKNQNLPNPYDNIPTYNLIIDSSFIVSDIIIISNFRILRDSLVAQGILKPPYTDTNEYKELIKSSVLYWKNEKWVRKDEL